MFIFKEMTDKYKKRCIKGTYKETHKRDMYTFYKDIFTDFYLQTTKTAHLGIWHGGHIYIQYSYARILSYTFLVIIGIIATL